MLTFTPDQSLALDFPGNVIISAGAGSGKTRILVEKYIRLLADEHPDWPVDSVVAITFTRKAAAELKSRIVKRVLEQMGAEEHDSQRMARLKTIRTEVGAAPIGTIHNFCGRILREFAFDAKIDPDYTILEGAHEGALRFQAAKESIAEITSQNEARLYRDLLVLLNLLSAGTLTEMLASMLGDRATYVQPAKRFAENNVESLFDELQEFHLSIVGEIRTGFIKSWSQIFEQISQRALPGIVRDLAISALEAFSESSENAWESYETAINTAIDGLLTKSGTCRKREFLKAGFEEFDSLRENLEKLATQFKKAITSDLSILDKRDLERTQRLARLFLYTVDKYTKLRGGDSERSEAQLLDFSDLEILAYKLVNSSAEIRRRLRSLYPYLIIDEFQDTSQYQWDILKAFVTDESGSLYPSSLFVVGDRKQGVYGFRDANVRLFSSVQKLVAESNMEWSASFGLVSMSANFRSDVKPLEFINKVFDNLLSQAGNEYGVEFEALSPKPDKPDGCVEFLVSSGQPSSEDFDESSDKPTADELRDKEAELVAAHVKNLIDRGEAKPGEIALLFRKRSIFSLYENALKRLEVPCVVQQGLNLFHQPELADFTAVLNALIYPHQDVIFVHYLRSPFVGFSDDLLLKIARTHGRSFWDKANRVFAERKYQLDDVWHPITDFERERLDFALGVLERIRSQVGFLKPYEIIRRLIEDLGVFPIVSASYRGEQAVANIEKLISVAQSADNLGFEDFLNFIRSEEQSSKGIGEAADLTTVDAVKIMTIHAAKGLEFPVVYLPNLNAGSGGRPGNASSDGERWMSLRLSKTLVDEPSFLTRYFDMVSELQSNAEERRIFYVAMTRCENRLILSANEDARAKGETFYNWINDEFQSAKNAGVCQTSDDFPDHQDDELLKARNMPAIKRFSRDHQIESAYRAAEVLDRITVCDHSGTGYYRSAIHGVLMKYFKNVITADKDLAWQQIEKDIPLITDANETSHYKALFLQAGDWLCGQMSESIKATVQPRLHMVNGNNPKTIVPDLRIGKRIGWIILDEKELPYARMEAGQFSQFSSGFNEMPVPCIWLLTSNEVRVIES